MAASILAAGWMCGMFAPVSNEVTDFGRALIAALRTKYDVPADEDCQADERTPDANADPEEQTPASAPPKRSPRSSACPDFTHCRRPEKLERTSRINRMGSCHCGRTGA